MSKIGKTIVTLGVVAGLGVACLPLSSYALDHTADNPAEDLDVLLEVKDSISLEIQEATSGDATFTPAVEAGEGGTPAAANASLDFGKLDADGSLKSGSVNAVVSTSHVTGYKLEIQGKDGVTDMGSIETGSSAKIQTLQTGETDLTTNMKDASGKEVSRWAYKLSTATNYSPIPAAAQEIAKKNTAIGNDKTEVVFGVVVAPGQEEGSYRGTVTLTATINN